MIKPGVGKRVFVHIESMKSGIPSGLHFGFKQNRKCGIARTANTIIPCGKRIIFIKIIDGRIEMMACKRIKITVAYRDGIRKIIPVLKADGVFLILNISQIGYNSFTDWNPWPSRHLSTYLQYRKRHKQNKKEMPVP